MPPTGLFRAILFVMEQLVLRLVYDPFCLSDGQFKFFSKRLIGKAVKEAALQNLPVSLFQDPFVYKDLKFRARQVKIFHFFFTFRPFALPFLFFLIFSFWPI